MASLMKVNASPILYATFSTIDQIAFNAAVKPSKPGITKPVMAVIIFEKKPAIPSTDLPKASISFIESLTLVTKLPMAPVALKTPSEAPNKLPTNVETPLAIDVKILIATEAIENNPLKVFLRFFEASSLNLKFLVRSRSATVKS